MPLERCVEEARAFLGRGESSSDDGRTVLLWRPLFDDSTRLRDVWDLLARRPHHPHHHAVPGLIGLCVCVNCRHDHRLRHRPAQSAQPPGVGSFADGATWQGKSPKCLDRSPVTTKCFPNQLSPTIAALFPQTSIGLFVSKRWWSSNLIRVAVAGYGTFVDRYLPVVLT